MTIYKHKLVCILLLVTTLYSCNKPKEDENLSTSHFGKSISYEKFLWKDARNDTLQKSFVYSFNNWAAEANSSVTITLNNGENELIKNKVPYHFLVNDTPIPDGKIILKSTNKTGDTINLKLVIPTQINTDFFGYITIADHNLDRVNDIENPNNTNIYKWSATQEIQMNPLKVILLWVLAITATCLFIYLLILRPIIFKRMGKGQITIQQPFFKNINVKNNIELVFTNKKHKQGFFNKIFQGKRTTITNNFFTNPIYFTPSVKSKIRIRTGGHYSIEPFTTTFEKGIIYEITNNNTKEKITITYL
ncbi:hypothetical protein [Myroides phaeus]|uniref:Uncharacterized protein n=1 Tax=Myroides phaeus TaxID=702745 RepID=A0A1G8CTC7_9FLAO|nr:hypothetical protein [Myroides phaeus]SDH48736.1 hypothetical protein SAMN05421818_1052 [Myroides phaeus]